MSKVMKLTSHHPESNNKPKGKVMKFSPKQKRELFHELSYKQREDFVKKYFAFEYFSNTKGAKATEANKIYEAKIMPLGGWETDLGKEHKNAISEALKGGKKLITSDYGNVA